VLVELTTWRVGKIEVQAVPGTAAVIVGPDAGGGRPLRDLATADRLGEVGVLEPVRRAAVVVVDEVEAQPGAAAEEAGAGEHQIEPLVRLDGGVADHLEL